MFLDGKHLQITESHDTTNYLRSIFIRGLPKMRNYLRKLHVTTSASMRDFTLWSYMFITELPPKATRYKLDYYIHLQLTLWYYSSKYVFCLA